jgi:hypothetical protein
VDAQYKCDGSPEFNGFVVGINNAFTVIFAIELSVNLFANWMRKFFSNGWNWLDLLIVFMSLIDLGMSIIPDWLVRLMRAFRVVRLFGQVEQLTKMIPAIAASLLPMVHAFVILAIVVSICEHEYLLCSAQPTRTACRHGADAQRIAHSADAILGVSLFSDVAPDQFGRFNRAFMALFRIAAGDTWIDALPTLGPDGEIELRPAFYICSFIVVSVWVVLQVSVAVLLDNFVTVSMRMENDEKERAAIEKKASSQFQNPLEPLIAKLANDYTDTSSLSTKLASLFQVRCARAHACRPLATPARFQLATLARASHDPGGQ